MDGFGGSHAIFQKVAHDTKDQFLVIGLVRFVRTNGLGDVPTDLVVVGARIDSRAADHADQRGGKPERAEVSLNPEGNP